MRIAIIGTGKVGTALGTNWLRAGHTVRYGSRTPIPEIDNVRPIADALQDADVVLLAQPGSAVDAFVADHESALSGKVVVDAANRIGERPVNSRAALSAVARVGYVRAFNNVGVENFVAPLPETDLFFAADPDAREIAERLITDMGLRPVYVGDADAADLVDGLLGLWFALAQQRGNRHIGFRLVE